mmetsp:Transcript_38443/g.56527  ORF Transcript_38443/g.56527 Transcript_38443/m.56527 type:complete len:275 (+) Transcript_38443:652-1476(+)
MRTVGTSAKRWILLECTTYPCASTGAIPHDGGISTKFLTTLTMCSCVVGTRSSLVNFLSSSEPTACAMSGGITTHAVSDRKGPNERWFTLCDTSIVAQLNSCPSEIACTMMPPGAFCTCNMPATMQPTPLWLSFSPSLFASITRDLGTSDLICFMSSLDQPTMASTVRSPWYLSSSFPLGSSRRNTMIVGKASILCVVQSDSALSDVQSTLARIRRSSPGCVSDILAAAFSHTGSSFWHQWHHGVKKFTITMSCFLRSSSKLSVVSDTDLISPS